MRAIGRKAIDLKRRDRDYLFREEEIVQTKSRTGAIWTGISLAFVASIFSSVTSFLSGHR